MPVSSLQIFKRYIKSDQYSQIPQIKYKTNFTTCIYQALQNRGYLKTIQDDWNIIWSQKDGLNQIYQKRLQPGQKVNHFRTYYQLCKKDNLIKNLKKHKKLLQKQGKNQQSKQYNFFPQTYLLPSQYVLFADQFKKYQQQYSNSNQNIWIMKPIGKSQGKGIFLINKLNQLSSWQSTNISSSNNQVIQPYIIQKYINNPLLIGGKKFDIRIYVLVVNYNPLTVYLYRNGFARFTHSRYDQTKITDTEVHLTNVAIQKNSQNYDQNIGGKWYLDKLKTYLISKYTSEKVNQSFLKIQNVIIKTLQSMTKLMGNNDKLNSFQLYGFDILFDSYLDPWLIQVNGSPSMTANTTKDRQIKLSLLDDTFTLLDLQKFLTGNQQQIGGFDLICKKNPKDNTKSMIEKSKLSFLGTAINRQDNYKKLAKIYANKLPDTNIKLKSQKNLNQIPKDRRKAMSQSNNQHSILSSNYNNQMVKKNSINSNLNGSRRIVPLNPPKQFVIKQKNVNPSLIKRQKTNQNQPIK